MLGLIQAAAGILDGAVYYAGLPHALCRALNIAGCWTLKKKNAHIHLQLPLSLESTRFSYSLYLKAGNSEVSRDEVICSKSLKLLVSVGVLPWFGFFFF